MSKYSIYSKYEQVRKELQAIYPNHEANAMARILIEHVTDTHAHSFLADRNLCLSSNQFEIINSYLSELKLQKPIQYVLGETEFYNIKFNVNPQVLIPRPETEELVRWIISENKFSNPKILDIGTGSGCIAIALAKYIPNAKVFALDVSKDALEIARQNALSNNVDVSFIECDILNYSDTNLKDSFDIIVSNPPYVRESEKGFMLSNVLDNEPHQALFVSDTLPLIFYQAIASFAKHHLKEGGLLYCEINEALGTEMLNLFEGKSFKDVEVRKDINEKDRMIRGGWLSR